MVSISFYLLRPENSFCCSRCRPAISKSKTSMVRGHFLNGVTTFYSNQHWISWSIVRRVPWMFLLVRPQWTHHYPGWADGHYAIARAIAHDPGVDLLSEEEEWPHEFCRFPRGDVPTFAGGESTGGGHRSIPGRRQERPGYDSGPPVAPLAAKLGWGIVLQRGECECGGVLLILSFVGF